MGGLRLSLFLIVLLGFVCTANSNPILNLFGKGGDEKAEDVKTTVSAGKSAETTTTTTTTTAASDPGSSCGGLKGFLHICDKPGTTEPPKSVKTRSVPEEDDSTEEDSSDSDSDTKEEDDDVSDDDDKEEEKAETKQEETTSPVSETTEGKVEKRQVEDPEPPIVDEVPLPPEEPSDYVALKKRQVDSGEESSESESDEEATRRGRDCRDRYGDYGKDCRRKRELVPCMEPKCMKLRPTPADD